MKNRKWLTYTLGALLTLIVLAVVAVAGFRVGMMQNSSFMRRPVFASGFQPKLGTLPGNRDPQAMPGNPPTGSQPKPGTLPGNRDPQVMPGNPSNGFNGMQGNRFYQGFDPRRNDHFGGGQHRGRSMFFLPPIFGLIHLLILIILIWVVYKLIQNSGWRLTRVETPAAAASEPVSVVKEKKKQRN